MKSHRGTQFRIWATQRLKVRYQGFTLDDERLKRAGQMNYFDGLLARIRDIRGSERCFAKGQRHCMRRIGYCRKQPNDTGNFKIVQNKLLWAVSKQTAAEIIARTRRRRKTEYGLTTWAGAKGSERAT
ncbi:MAG: virulence RhuM family protein [Saprospirales bacterium]|nr:virulence RhuM family protein [Saprospirales bacterium]